MSRILVIEDEEQLLEAILSALRQEDFEVIGALDGAAGAELVRTYKPNLIISEIHLPELDGYDLLQSLRDQDTTGVFPENFRVSPAGRYVCLR